ncbi:MAG: cytochrome c biogenesis protein CcsA [Propionibacteriaceae bacterium]
MSPSEFGSVSNLAVAGAIALYVLAMVTYAAATARRGALRRSPVLVGGGAGSAATQDDESFAFLERLALSLVWVAAGLHTASLVARALAAGRAPWGNMYEFTLALTWAATAAFLVFGRTRTARDLGVWLVGLVVLSLGLAVTVLYAPAEELIPVLQSYWLVVHVAAAITAGGLFTVGAVASVGYLVKARGGSPEALRLDRFAYGVHLFAFPIWTFAVMAGAIWAENAWGRYWGWDPKETWAFITWVCYAAYLHAQATPRWRGRRANYLALAGYAAFVFNFFGVNIWIPGLHSYAGV